MATLSFFFMALPSGWLDAVEATAPRGGGSTAKRKPQRHRDTENGRKGESDEAGMARDGGTHGDRGFDGRGCRRVAEGLVPYPLRRVEALRRPAVARRIALLGREAAPARGQG